MDKASVKRIYGWILNILLYIFLATAILAVIATLFSRKDKDGTAELFGIQMRIVTSDSMAKCEHTDVEAFEIKDIPVRSLIIVDVIPDDLEERNIWYRSLKVGDVLTFRYVYTKQITITHRVTSIAEKETGGFVIELAGDNKNSEDGQLTQLIDTSVPNNTNYVIGKVIGKAYLPGVIMSFLMQPVGMITVIILPCFIIILLEIMKIIKVLGAEKREKQSVNGNEDEIILLKRKLAELERELNEEKSREDKG